MSILVFNNPMNLVGTHHLSRVLPSATSA